jgi:hypothetical protein
MMGKEKEHSSRVVFCTRIKRGNNVDEFLSLSDRKMNGYY